MKTSSTVGIDIGTHAVRVVVCDRGVDGTAGILGSGEAKSHGMRHGYVVNRDEVARTLMEAIRKAETASGTKIRHAALCVGGVGIGCEYATGTAIITRADSIISKFDIEKAISDAEVSLDLKNKTILYALPTFFLVDGKEIPGRPEGVVGMKLEVRTLFVNVFSQHVDDLVAIATDLGIKVTQLYPAPIVASNLILTELQKNLGCVLVDLGAETTSVSVYENNMLTATHVFGVGSLDITKDLALGLRISPEDAENLKLGVVSFQQVPKKKVDEIVEARLSDIFDLVNKYLKKIGRSGLLPAGAILVGGGSQLPLVETVAKNTLKIPAKIGRLDIGAPSPQNTTAHQSSALDIRLANAYAAASSGASQSRKRASSHDGENENIITAIKHFFKQLMP